MESLWSSFMGLLSSMIQPLYWALSGLLYVFHALWTPVFGYDSGVTWVLTIITLVIAIRTLLIPLFVKQINASRNMQLVQPKLRALQEKYAGDREKLGMETQKLMAEEGVNPLSSCLPILLQMPIFLALFRVLEGASRGVPRGAFFRDNPELLHSLQNATFLGAELSGRAWPLTDGFGPTAVMAILLIIGMTAVLFITQLQLMRKNMPPEALTGPMAQQQKMMLYMFPVMYAVGGAFIPIGVLLYWFTTNLWTLGQQYLLIHNNPTPGTPAHVDWQERMRAKGKDPDEIERRRREKLRGKAKSTPAGTTTTADGETKVTVVRQGSTRSVVKTDASGAKQVVTRQQPARQTRAARKKK
ncbi:membrane protein insertase YidC [Propionibacteriaceae bacterium Y1923]|uniref:membrane protein insertase YidC n=1 Tax=Aestuariimicrobium sp. Y1814 TaxID=3418742 RepID=UPI003C234893